MTKDETPDAIIARLKLMDINLSKLLENRAADEELRVI